MPLNVSAMVTRIRVKPDGRQIWETAAKSHDVARTLKTAAPAANSSRRLRSSNPIPERLFVDVASAEDDHDIAFTVQADLASQQRRRSDRARWFGP